MVGKLTNDHEMSCSILATAAGENPWKSEVELLGEMITAKNGGDIRQEQSVVMSRGDTLEPVLLKQAGEDLGLDRVLVDIELPIRHPSIPLQGSLDGLCWSNGKTIKEDPEKGVYVLTDTKEIYIEGNGVMECKLTSAYPEDEPPSWRGPMQLQGLMDIKAATYGVLVICYQSIYWRYFIYERDDEMVARIHELVKDMDRRIKEEDFFPPKSPSDAGLIYQDAKDEHIELEEDALDFIDLYNHAEKSIKHWQSVKEDAQVSLMSLLGENTSGSVTLQDTTYHVKWPVRTYKPQPEKVTPAKPGYTARQKSISIKEITNED